MTNANRARYLHRLLDLLVDKRDIGVRNIEKLRAELPEIPKQKTLEDLCQEVYDVWAGAHGNEWPDDVHVDLETWLDELHTQLKGLTPAKPAHPEFLETQADYENAPVGTIVTLDAEKLLDAVEKPVKIIRAVEELEELDLDALLMNGENVVKNQWSWFGDYERGIEDIFPLAIISTSSQMRAAREAMKEEHG